MAKSRARRAAGRPGARRAAVADRFGLAVHNASAGLFSIARADRANHIALAAGPATIEHAVIEACGLLADGAPMVLLVACDAPLPAGAVGIRGLRRAALCMGLGDGAAGERHAAGWRAAAAPMPACRIHAGRTGCAALPAGGGAPLERSAGGAGSAGPGAAMLDRICRGWRVLATGLSFACCSAWAAWCCACSCSRCWRCACARRKRACAARAVIRLALSAPSSASCALLGVLRYEVHGLDKLERGGQLILANHPTLIDTVFLIAFVRNADCIVKGGLWNNPFTGGPVRAAGYIRNDGGPALVDDCIASLRAGGNLIVFPEGTRTPRGGTMAQARRGQHRGARRPAR
jgi:hypothetical protein